MVLVYFVFAPTQHYTTLASTSGASSSKPHIHSSMLYAMAGVLITFVILWRCPGLLALVPFSTTASTMAQ